ncbi:MAG: hypothetical protein IJS95_07165 [Prevotella sp.]|nr:hypothetical protein [Prevotella sp.]
MIASHVDRLCSNMPSYVETNRATEGKNAITLLKSGTYDLIHLHGCWRNSSRTVVNTALKYGTRLIITPHGELQPWVQQQNQWKEKMPKRIAYQQRIVEKAYAVIIQGKMEEECMVRLGWNPRCVIIRNSVITRSITPKEMAAQTYALYRKVMDSNPLELMNDDQQAMLKDIITVGITGDPQWLTSQHLMTLENEEWRRMLCYVEQEHISDTFKRGVRTLRLEPADIQIDPSQCFVPPGYEVPSTIEQVIGNQWVSENDRLVASFKHLKKLTSAKKLSILHLVELDKELRQHPCEEDKLCEALHEHGLYRLATRLMQLMSDKTGLTEGFMPMPPLNDRTTKRMRIQVENRMSI